MNTRGGCASGLPPAAQAPIEWPYPAMCEGTGYESTGRICAVRVVLGGHRASLRGRGNSKHEWAHET